MRRRQINRSLCCISSSPGDPGALLPLPRFGKSVTQHHLRKCPPQLRLGLVSFLVLTTILTTSTFLSPVCLLLVRDPSLWNTVLEIPLPRSDVPSLQGCEIRSYGLLILCNIKIHWAPVTWNGTFVHMCLFVTSCIGHWELLVHKIMHYTIPKKSQFLI